jgi:hypothetical protein
MRTCVRCGSSELARVWEWRCQPLGRHRLAGRVAVVRCPRCGARWPWAQPARSSENPWLLERLSPALLYLQAEGDLILVRWPDGRYEVVA